MGSSVTLFTAPKSIVNPTMNLTGLDPVVMVLLFVAGVAWFMSPYWLVKALWALRQAKAQIKAQAEAQAEAQAPAQVQIKAETQIDNKPFACFHTGMKADHEIKSDVDIYAENAWLTSENSRITSENARLISENARLISEKAMCAPPLLPKAQEMVSSLNLDSKAVCTAIFNQDMESLIAMVLAVLAPLGHKVLFNDDLTTFKCVKSASSSVNHGAEILATVLSYAIFLVNKPQMLGDIDVHMKSNGQPKAISTIYQDIGNQAPIPRPSCLALCTNKMDVTHRWAVAVAINSCLHVVPRRFQALQVAM